MAIGRQWTTLLTAGALVVAASGLAIFANFDRIAVALAPAKQAATTRSAAAVKGDELFWEIFHGGDYAQIQRALDALTAAYLETPTDAVTAAHIAWLHNWRIAERARLSSVTATITDDTIVARRYFEEATKLNPSDARVLGFLAGHLLAEGSINKDEKLTRQGYYQMLDAIEAWPEFNLFTAGYVMSRLPYDSERFREGIAWEWRNLDVCIGETLDRANPDYTKYLRLETKEGEKRVCWNSWIAPHNLEGFFLNLGDMLVKAGDWQTAQKIYGNAKLVKDYPSWKFQAVLEARIANAQANVEAFRAPNGKIMLNSEFACMACHRE